MSATKALSLLTLLSGLAGLAGLGGCAGTPPPDWALDAQGALERGLQARLSGEDRIAVHELAIARAALARTGRADLLARAELKLCAADAASLRFEPCAAFEALRQDAAAPELAYAEHLRAPLEATRRPLLPPAQQALATPPDGRDRRDGRDGLKGGDGGDAGVARLQAVADPLSRLLGAALWLRDGQASPAVIALAVDTASAQGWRRPLLAWLQAQKLRAERDGDAELAARAQRRIELVLGGPRQPTPRENPMPC